jgi:hypothetical protein
LAQRGYNRYVQNPLNKLQRAGSALDGFLGGLGFKAPIDHPGFTPNDWQGKQQTLVNDPAQAAGMAGTGGSQGGSGSGTSGSQGGTTPQGINLNYQTPPWYYPYYTQGWAFPPGFKFGQ